MKDDETANHYIEMVINRAEQCYVLVINGVDWVPITQWHPSPIRAFEVLKTVHDERAKFIAC